jgi:dedicator of cytokinesis protein 3
VLWKGTFSLKVSQISNPNFKNPILTKFLIDFEATFAPELASFAFPQQQRDPTPTPSWAISSPVSSDGTPNGNKQQSGMIGRGIPNNGANGTVVTSENSIIDTPGAKASKNRLSFLKRHNRDQSMVAQEAQAVLAPVINGGNATATATRTQRRESNDTSSERSRSKENRKSFFSAGVGSIGRGRGRLMSEKEEDADWVTQSDLAGMKNQNQKNGSLGRRSSSSQRPKTGKSGGREDTNSVGSRVGSVRKRLSMLKLGKKTSKASGLVGSVTEED